MINSVEFGKILMRIK